MKKYIVLSIFLLGSILIMAQPPQKMSYQAVVRDGQNNLVVNQPIGVQVSILESFPNGMPIYIETHQVTTNGNGLMTLEIGMGTPNPGSNFSTIAWRNNDYYLQSEIDITGGSQYTLSGTQQLITVPYAFYAGEAAYADSSNYDNLSNRPAGINTGDLLYWDAQLNDWQVVPVGSAGQVLTLNPNGIPQWYSTIFNQNLPPSIITDTIFDITGRTAKVRAIITDVGTTDIIASGVCWSTTPNPSLGNNYTVDGTSIGTFVSNIHSLLSGETYYARAYATNSIGTRYGQPISFTTPTHCGTVTDYDGNVYQSVYIGAQCWMKENLKTTKYSNGVAISKGTLGTQIYNVDKYYYIYNDNEANKNIYGLLYTWKAVMNGAGVSDNNPSGIQGICPAGWHLPSHSEWCELENHLEPGIDANCSTSGYRGSMATKLTLPQYWTSDATNSFAPGYWTTDPANFNTSDFSATPSGYYQSNAYNTSSSYGELYNTGYWWTCSSTSDNNYKRYRSITYNNSGINSTSRTTYVYSSDTQYAFSVRCIKN